jgi:hypothetical protein
VEVNTKEKKKVTGQNIFVFKDKYNVYKTDLCSSSSYPKCIIEYKNQRTQNLKKPTHNDIKKTSNNDDQYNNFKKILLNDQCNPFEQDFVERPMQPI